MKIATFIDNGKPGLGIVNGNIIVPLSQILPRGPSDMVELIADWDNIHNQINLAAAGDAGLLLSEVHLLAPVLRPGKVLAIGLNYADHVAETGREPPEHQVWFAKLSSIWAPFDDIQIPKASSKIDYEVELVAIIGKPGRHISREDAPKHVFGYCVGNDVSVRDWQRLTPQWTLAKSFDTHGPIGPWITTADEIGDPHRLDITCRVNGDVRQSSNTRHLIFDVWAQIEYLSKAMTLQPGDVIFTGTPGGVGAMAQPPVFLTPGDRVRCEIGELGAIEGVMVNEA
jgi:ureidoglycolate lyase